MISFSRYGIVDVLPRYSRLQEETYLRRHQTVVAEYAVDDVIDGFSSVLQACFISMPQKPLQLPWDAAHLPCADGSFLSHPMVAMVAGGKAGVDSLNASEISEAAMQV